MQTDNRLFDDLAKMANGALNTLSGLRDEIELRVRERVERWLAEMDMVPREEFEAIKAMAQTARSEQEDLAARVAELERQVAALMGTGPEAQKAADRSATRAAAKPATRRRTTKSATAKAGAGPGQSAE
jgi:BMFP domain-containing protein YqiC